MCIWTAQLANGMMHQGQVYYFKCNDFQNEGPMYVITSRDSDSHSNSYLGGHKLNFNGQRIRSTVFVVLLLANIALLSL
jgi:hypothetical protein